MATGSGGVSRSSPTSEPLRLDLAVGALVNPCIPYRVSLASYQAAPLACWLSSAETGVPGTMLPCLRPPPLLSVLRVDGTAQSEPSRRPVLRGFPLNYSSLISEAESWMSLGARFYLGPIGASPVLHVAKCGLAADASGFLLGGI